MEENYKLAFELLKAKWDRFVEERQEYIRENSFCASFNPEDIYRAFERYCQCVE